MNYNFEFNSPAIGRIQPFEYSYATTNEYAFTYGRDILSDLSKFNAPIFVARKRRGVFAYNKIIPIQKNNDYKAIINNSSLNFSQIRRGIFFDIFKDILIYRDRNGFNIFKDIDINTKRNRNEFNILEDVLSGKNKYENDTNIFEDYFLINDNLQKIEISNIISGTMSDKNKIFILEKFDNYFLSELHIKNSISKFSKNIFVKNKSLINILNNNKNILTKSVDKYLDIQKTFLLLDHSVNINKVCVYNQYILSNPDNKLNTFNNYIMLFNDKDCDNANLYKNYFVQTPINYVVLSNNFTIEKNNINKIFINKTIKSKRNNLQLNINKQLIVKNKHILDTNVYKTHLLKDNLIKIHFNKCYNIYNKNKNFILRYKMIIYSKYKYNVTLFKDITLKYDFDKNINLNKDNIFLYKDFTYDKVYLNKDITLSKSKKNFKINNTENTLFKSKKSFVINETEKNIIKEKYKFEIKDTAKFTIKDRHGFTLSNNFNNLFKSKHVFSINEINVKFKKAKKDFNIDEFTEAIYKDRYSISIHVTETDLSKIRLPIDIESHYNTIGFIVSEKKSFIKKPNQLLYKIFKNVFNKDTTEFLDKDKKRTNLLTNLFIITEQKKIFLEYYHNNMLEKNAKNCFIDMLNEFVEKNTKNVIINNNIISITKRYKNIFINKNIYLSKKLKEINLKNKDIFIDKKQKDIQILNYIYLSKKEKEIFIDSNMWINKQSHKTNIFNQESIIKIPYEVYMENENIFIDKARYYTSINDFLNINKKEKYIYETKNVEITKEGKNANSENYTFITKQQYENNQYISQMIYMQKLMKELEKSVEKTYNWVYVYQYEDPIDPNYDFYGLDELLLPEKDIDYSSFEDAIFDKKNMKPKNPIKILDDNTFIAKYPIKHPTPDYEDIGIVYIDVPSELMYTIFTKFYQIWYANIFKFGNMSMIESLKLMLEYMYAYIVTTFSGTSYLEQALRVFRQIRWFGETSVMHNAQYKITYEYEDLKSNLQTGECMIENELQGFFVDTKLKVLSTELTSLNQEAYIKLYIPNKEETTISFSISFTGGNVEVYINNNLVDVIYSNHALIVYDLPETDGKNEFMLKRSINNNFGQCYVGNVIIKNGTFKNLNIEYDPELKAGNMPLNDIVNKMVILANMYEDEEKAFEQFREGNLAVSELYKRLENYWELHHANKIKGKRLTIKET